MSSDIVAAIDLGSNSFHMIVARIANGQVQTLDRLREMVQLAAGLDSRNRLSEESQLRALDCLARFGQRLRQIPPEQLRVVGTNTLRQARNSTVFLARAEAVLGHNIETISGQEEARLIYLGVVHNVADAAGQRLVVDIGGGSTELILGEKFEIHHLTSLKMGCVSLSRSCFDKGRITESRMREAELLVQLKLEPVREEFRDQGWQVATGASGTIKAIQDVVAREGWSREGITLEALRRLRAALLEAGRPETMAARWQLEPARAQVFAGGFVVLHGLCEALGVERMEVSEGALREGVIYDLLGRIRHEDVRDRTIATVIDRYDLDKAQAERVSATAWMLLNQVRDAWHLSAEELAHNLEWAARLHEIGLLLTHDQYHKHGAYILEHADLPGFSQSDQILLATLVRRHRRGFPAKAFEHLPKERALLAQRLCVLLRLAVVLHRGRSRHALPMLSLQVNRQQLALRFPEGWLDANPLTQADLDAEARYLKKAGFRLAFS
ncbi:MAG TPA: exopolyphosphatase [Candidatus Competibacteraceae bacterium]|nr:exopolyphosphatase [Candidatus Competibacteraceae bacterium]MCP5134956.1 exopolyphosphatase [Gammaproteobacteria bacterium]HPF57450.1 exopolyphosphatase [Candidatus Competibacteraceae bacterium]HRY17156.1 exopolyphosphatase [Candidatus Competibacteraceae bacterium]